MYSALVCQTRLWIASHLHLCAAASLLQDCTVEVELPVKSTGPFIFQVGMFESIAAYTREAACQLVFGSVCNNVTDSLAGTSQCLCMRRVAQCCLPAELPALAAPVYNLLNSNALSKHPQIADPEGEMLLRLSADRLETANAN